MTCREGLRREPRSSELSKVQRGVRERQLTQALATNDPLEVAPALARARRWLDGAHLAEAEARLRALTQARLTASLGQ